MTRKNKNKIKTTKTTTTTVRRNNRPRPQGPKKQRRVVVRRGGPKNKQTARLLLNTSIPKPSLKVVGNGETMVISGTEIIQRVLSTEQPTVKVVHLNPLQSDTFPRLHALAMQYERFRFKSVTASYHTACPATQSGSIGLAIHTEYTLENKVNTDFPNFGSYEYSCVGSVGASMRTPTWQVKDPEFFYQGFDNLVSTDPLKCFQGTVAVLLADCRSTDEDVVAGYVALHYVIELRSARPTPMRLLNGHFDGVTNGTELKLLDITQANPAGRNFVPVTDEGITPDMVGRFPLDKPQNILENVTTDPAFTGVNIMEGLVASVLNSWFGWQLQLGAVGATPRDPSFDYDDCKIYSPKKKGDEYSVMYYNPKYVPYPPSGAEPLDEKELSDFQGVVFHHKRNPKTPMVTGDMTINLAGWDPVAQAVVLIAQWLFSQGTGAQTLNDIVQLSLGNVTSIFLQAFPSFATDVRYLLQSWETYSPMDFGV